MISTSAFSMQQNSPAAAAASPEEQGAYLRTFLEPLATWLEDKSVTDILINRPGEVWLETVGSGLRVTEAPQLTAVALQRLALQVAATSSQGLNREHPLLSAALPNGERVQVVLPPASREHIAIAIRKHVVEDLRLEQYHANGAFANVRCNGQDARSERRALLRQFMDARDFVQLLRSAVRMRANIVISGGTASGKTTLLNSLLKEIPSHERLIVIEDTPEVQIDRANSLGLVAVKGELRQSRVKIDDLLEAALRMRPDRLFVGEIRGAEAFSFLRAINTGHPGSITTVHADSAQGALDQISLMTLQAGLALSRTEVVHYARTVIDLIVQVARENGKRLIAEIAICDAG